MRILALNWTDWKSKTAGGSETHLYEMFRRWVSKGHEVTLVCGYHAGLRDARNRTHREIDEGIEILRSGPWYLTHRTVPRLARRLLWWRRFDVILDAVNKLPLFAPRWAGGTPVLAIVHHLFGKTIERDFGWLQARYYLALERRIPRAYGETRLIAISPSTKRSLVALGLSPERIEVVRCGLEPSYLHPHAVPRSQDPLLLVISRLRRYKRVDLVLEAFARLRALLPSAQLWIAGIGADERRLKALARRLGLGDSVRFLGQVSEAEKKALLARAHLLVNASEVEGWGLTSIEANAYGTPVLAADSPGLRDSVRDGETGRLFPRGDAGALARIANEVLTDARGWERLSGGARRWAKRFDWEETARRTFAILEEVTRGGERPLPPPPLPATAEVLEGDREGVAREDEARAASEERVLPVSRD